MNRSKSPKREMNPDRLGILGVVLASFEAGAGRIRPAAARQRGLDYFARGSHDAYIDAAESNLVARFGDCMPGAGVKSRVRILEKVVGCLAGLNVRAVIDELFNRHLCRELRRAAEMIAVPVRDNQMIDLPQAGIFDGSHDAARIAWCGGAGVARVHEERRTGRRHEKRRVAAFNVDDVDVQRPRCARLSDGQRGRGQDDGKDEHRNDRGTHDITSGGLNHTAAAGRVACSTSYRI